MNEYYFWAYFEGGIDAEEKREALYNHFQEHGIKSANLSCSGSLIDFSFIVNANVKLEAYKKAEVIRSRIEEQLHLDISGFTLVSRF